MSYAKQMLDTYPRSFNVDASRHGLRHSAITTWLNAGVPIKTAQLPRWRN